MRQWILLLVTGLLLAGCGDSSDLRQISGQQIPAGSAPVNDRLTGVWGAYFPGHEADQDQGVEIQFDRQQREGFILRGNGPAPHEMEFTRNGDSLRIVLTDPHDADDQSVITGTLVNPTTLSGRFVNQSRGEDHAVELVRHPNSDQFLVGGVPLVTAQDVGITGPIEILQITGTGDDGQTFRFDVWPGYPGYYRMDSPRISTGYCYIQPLYWFGSYSSFELTEYDPADPGLSSVYLGSLYLLVDDWAKVGYQPLTLAGSGDGSYIDDYPNGIDFGPTATYIKDFTIQVISSPTTEFNSFYNIYKEPYDANNVFLFYSDRFPAVTRLVAYYLDQYSY